MSILTPLCGNGTPSRNLLGASFLGIALFFLMVFASNVILSSVTLVTLGIAVSLSVFIFLMLILFILFIL